MNGLSDFARLPAGSSLEILCAVAVSASRWLQGRRRRTADPHTASSRILTTSHLKATQPPSVGFVSRWRLIVRPLARSATRGVLERYALGIGGGDFGIIRPG